MTPSRTYDPGRANRLSSQLEAALACLSQLGPYAANTDLPGWFRQAVVSLLSGVEEFLPEDAFLEGIKGASGQPQPPSQLATQADKCWELGLPLSLGRNALRLFAETDRAKFGFRPRDKK